MITLESITIDGFRAYKVETNFSPTKEPGLKLITGVNKTNKRLGANGAGKSSLWDAMVWCLYGTSVKGLRSSDLVSWGGKNIHVVVELGLGGTIIRVERTSKPPRLSLDGALAEQSTVDRKIGLSRSRFLHSVLFGQAVRLFPDLSLPERAALFDDIMDLGLWNKASQRSVEEYNVENAKLSNAENAKARIEAELASLTRSALAGLEEASLAWDEQVEDELSGARRTLLRERKLLTQAQLVFDQLPNAEKPPELVVVNDDLLNARQERDKLLRRQHTVKANSREAYKTIAFYTHQDECSVCKQMISIAFKEKMLAGARKATKETEAEDYEIQNTIRDVDRAVEKLERLRDDVLATFSKASERSKAAASALHEQERRVRRAEGVIQDIEEQAAAGNPHASRLTRAKEHRKRLREQLNDELDAVEEAQRKVNNIDYWRTGFKKVKLFELKRTLDMLTIDVNNAIGSLGLNGWSVEFVTDTDNKSGGIRSGIQIVVRSPASTAVWEAWSGGEGQRLRVAIAVGFSNLILRLAGTEFGFEVWDEPSSWLSSEGVEDLLSTLAHRAQQTGKSVWILDHRALQFTAFSEIWEVKKNRKGSTIARVQ